MEGPPPEDPSGIMVYPKIPLPGGRPGEPAGSPRVRGFTSGGGGGYDKRKIAIGLGVAAVVGGLLGFLVAPSHKAEAKKAQADLAAAQQAATSEKARADGLEKELTTAKRYQADAEQKVQDLQSKADEVAKKASDLDAEEKKIQGTIDKSQGSVSTEGDEIHLQLVDKVLFPTGEDQLTDKGKQVLDKVAAALKELPDKQIWVQGHTDDQPIFVHPKKPEPKPKTKGKAAAATKDEPDKEPEMARYHTNWELSAARALEVVHYLQDVAKVDPHRLAAVAFGQYRPISRRDRALNRRIEIVLYPRREILSKEAAAAAKK